MGANEKHDVTYHGMEYDFGSPEVVTAKRVRFMSDSDFTSWLETVRAEAKAEAWDECARSIVYEDGTPVEIASNSNPYKETA